jgi:hypothetical protein
MFVSRPSCSSASESTSEYIKTGVEWCMVHGEERNSTGRVRSRGEDIRRGVLIQAFPAPSNIFTFPSGEVVEVNSEAKVPGHIVLTRILSLASLAVL